jgi:anti-sigma-K factor RskA
MPVWAPLSLLLILALAAVNLLLWQRVNQLETAAGPGQMQAIPLTSTDAAPDASGYVIISPDGRNGAIVVDGLPMLDAEHEYQLWLIRDGQRTSGAVFSVDEDGYRGARIEAPESLFEYEAVGISPEPAGGSPAPTGEPVLQGTLFPR